MCDAHEGDADRLDYMLVCRPHGQADKDWQILTTMCLKGEEPDGVIPVHAVFGRNMTARACRWLADNVMKLMRFAFIERATRLDDGRDADGVDFTALRQSGR